MAACNERLSQPYESGFGAAKRLLIWRARPKLQAAIQHQNVSNLSLEAG
jgi:hypothetical protein